MSFPGGLSDQTSVLKHPHSVVSSQTEIKFLFCDHQKPAGGNTGSLRDHILMIIVIILYHDAGDVQRLPRRIGQLDPVRTVVGII